MPQDVTITVRAEENMDGTIWIRAQGSQIVGDEIIAVVRPEDIVSTVRPPWRPTEGQPAYYYGLKVRVIAIDDDHAWIQDGKNGRKTTVGIEHLKEKS